VNYGAIAYAVHNGAFGYSFHYHSAAEAEQQALTDCNAKGAGCKVVISFSETCAALAAGDNEKFAASRGDGRGDAQGQALAACSRNGGKHCEIKVWSCARD
jgi:serine/threonine-protein kinase